MEVKKTSAGSDNWLEELEYKNSESDQLTLTSIRIPLGFYKQVETIAVKQGLSQAEVMRRLMRKGLQTRGEV